MGLDAGEYLLETFPRKSTGSPVVTAAVVAIDQQASIR